MKTWIFDLSVKHMLQYKHIELFENIHCHFPPIERTISQILYKYIDLPMSQNNIQCFVKPWHCLLGICPLAISFINVCNRERVGKSGLISLLLLKN